MRRRFARAGSAAALLLAVLPAALAAASCDPGLSPPRSEQAQLTGGAFAMGSTALCMDEESTACAGDRPVHPVKLSPFALDKTEVSRLQYSACVVAGACRAEAAAAFDADHRDDPVVINDPAQARAYCAWKGLRLPTEAEFEFASRVDAAGMVHTYPWGDSAPTCDRVQHEGCPHPAVRAVTAVTGDVSPQGVLGLAGNVPEWVEDQYVPAAGCADRLGYGDLCWGRGASCAADRCTADGKACVKGCLAPADDVLSSTPGGDVLSTPQCPAQADGAPALTDPVLHAATSYAVVRGGGPGDRSCDFAGFTRRHATPRRFLAGFRCAKSATPPQPPVSYRFHLAGCPSDTFPVKLSTVNTAGQPANYSLVLYPAGSSGAAMTKQSFGGAVEGVPCGATFVLVPETPAALALTVSDAQGCVAGSAPADLSQRADLPSLGTDVIQLAPLKACPQ